MSAMRAFLPRAPRVAVDTEVIILLRQESNGKVIAEPVAGNLRDIAEGGACIELVTPLSSGFHLFYKTLNTKSFSLLVEGASPLDPEVTFSVAAMSVWMKSAEEDRPPGFRVGVQFRQKQKQLLKYFS